MARTTAPGIPLVSRFRGGESDTIREIPPEFRAALDMTVTEIPMPWDQLPPALSDTILASKAEQKLTSERTQRVTSWAGGTTTLLERYTDRYKQLGTRTRIFHPIADLGSIAVPSPTRDVNTKNLGNAHFIEDQEDSGTLFTQNLFERSVPDVTPDWAKALIQTKRQSYLATEVAADPTLTVPGDISITKEQVDTFNTKTEHVFRTLSLPKQRINSRTNKFKQVENVTEIFESDSTTPFLPTSTRDVEFEVLGDGNAVERRTDLAGGYTLFPQLSSETAIPDIVPEVFKAQYPLVTKSVLMAGTVTDPPVLGAQEWSRHETQEDLFNFRRQTTSRSGLVLPVSAVSTRTNRYKQVETVTQILEDDTTVPLTPTDLIDVTFTKIGNHMAIEERVSVPNIFTARRWEISIPNVIPPDMQAGIITTTQEQENSGLMTWPPPTGFVAFGDLSNSQEQTTEKTYRTKSTNLPTTSLPVILHGKENSSEFGGGVLDIIRTLDLSGLPTDTGLFVVSSIVKPLGNGLDFKETKQLLSGGPWPTISDKIFDEETQNTTQLDRQVVDPTYTPVTGGGGTTFYSEDLKAIDVWKSQRIRKTRTITAIDAASAIISYEYKPFQFPGYILGPYISQLKKASAQLVKHTIRTWFQYGGGPPLADERYTDTIYLINDMASGGGYERIEGVLHDDILVNGLFYPATTPSASQYIGRAAIFGAGTLAFTAGSAAVVGSGTNFGTDVHVGDILGIYPSGGFSCLSITDPTHLTLSSAFGVTGSGPNYWNRASGTPWLGNEKIIGVSMKPTDIPLLFKIQTVGVTMR